MGPAATLSDVCSDLVVQVILNKNSDSFTILGL